MFLWFFSNLFSGNRISIPFFFYKLAEQTDNLEQKADLLAQSYEVLVQPFHLPSSDLVCRHY